MQAVLPKRRRPALPLALLFLAGCTYPLPEPLPLRWTPPPFPAETATAHPFPLGETATYRARVYGIPAGVARLRVLAGSGGTIRADLSARTTHAAALVQALSESLQVVCSAETLRPQRSRMKAEIDGVPRRLDLSFDAESGSVLCRYRKGDASMVRLIPAATAWDPISAILMARSLDLTPPARHEMELVLGARLYHLVLDSVEQVSMTTPAGTFPRVHRVEAGLYAVGKERRPAAKPTHEIEAWIAADGARPVLRLEKRLGFGSFTVELEEWSVVD